MERLPERSLYDGTATEHLVFIVEQVADIDTELNVRSFRFSMSWYLIHDRIAFYVSCFNHNKHFKFGIHQRLQALCLFHPVQNGTWKRLHAVNLDEISGLTFFPRTWRAILNPRSSLRRLMRHGHMRTLLEPTSAQHNLGLPAHITKGPSTRSWYACDWPGVQFSCESLEHDRS